MYEVYQLQVVDQVRKQILKVKINHHQVTIEPELNNQSIHLNVSSHTIITTNLATCRAQEIQRLIR